MTALIRGVPCTHVGCAAHVAHPCEGCGRVAAGIVEPTYRIGDIIEFRHKDGTHVDRVSELTIIIRKWNLSSASYEYYTELYPEIPGCDLPLDDSRVVRLIERSYVLPFLWPTTPIKLGQIIHFDAGDGPESGTVEAIEFIVNKDGADSFYHLVGQGNDEPIKHKWLRKWPGDPGSTSDPVFKKDGAWWYFYDETWSEEHGPFKSEQQARAAVAEYAKAL